jgi:hypothetical protein
MKKPLSRIPPKPQAPLVKALAATTNLNFFAISATWCDIVPGSAREPTGRCIAAAAPPSRYIATRCSRGGFYSSSRQGTAPPIALRSRNPGTAPGVGGWVEPRNRTPSRGRLPPGPGGGRGGPSAPSSPSLSPSGKQQHRTPIYMPMYSQCM